MLEKQASLPLKKTLSKNAVPKADSLTRIIEDLNTQDAGQLIVVEGSRDRDALLKLGVRTRIMTLRNFLRLAATDWLEKEGLTEIIVLTDFDRRGKFYSRVIKKICSGRAKVNTHYKYRLRKSLGNWIKDVEGIPGFVRNRLNSV
ncbi:MAG: toprim domain-containing protein [Candidatus Brockarchaeota archaeon]|nr:toprim domain-containing protein [Candidatus Brockarchaeota archaeon]